MENVRGKQRELDYNYFSTLFRQSKRNVLLEVVCLSTRSFISIFDFLDLLRLPRSTIITTTTLVVDFSRVL
jgi:hypothetical protein